jgi:periplasmic protein TonB
MKRLSAVISLLAHAAAGVAVAKAQGRPAPRAQVRVQVAVVEKAPARVPPPAPERVEQPRPARPARVARAAPSPSPAPARPSAPPPAAEAAPPSPEEPVVVAGISFESTSAGGSFAMAAGNTLGASPDRTAREAANARPYRAAHYAPASDLTEMPQVLNRDAVEIRRYYPKDALRAAIEGDVILRLVVDADGSIADVALVKDPGHGLGAAALRAVREFRFSPGKAAGTPVATSIPFVIRFVIS